MDAGPDVDAGTDASATSTSAVQPAARSNRGRCLIKWY
jgi:hypothetical protein